MMITARRSGAHARSPADDILSALVIVRAASGRRLAGSAAIDSSTIAAHAPAPGDVELAQQAYGDHGFAVGPYIGISFAISASCLVFERQLGVKLAVDAQGTVSVSANGTDFGQEVPLDRVPPALRRHVEALTFMPPTSLHGSDEPATMI